MLSLKPIHTSLSPNSQLDDVIFALKSMFFSGVGKTKLLEEKFRKEFSLEYVFSASSGRSSLFIILKALNIKEGDEILTQAFTCNAVPNPILWAGGKPVYVDIDDSLNIDPLDIERKISSNTKAIIVQHTLGIPAKLDIIAEIAKKHNVILIEDCAHSLGAYYNGRKVGTFGDISFFSFGRDKVISSVWGGVIATNNEGFARKIGEIHKTLLGPSRSWTIKQLFHPLLFSIIIPTYYIFGKYLLAFLRIIRGVGLAVSQKERMGERPGMFPARMPDALAALALHQFDKLEMYNKHRREIAEIYRIKLSKPSGSDPYGYRGQTPMVMPPEISGAIYLRFNILHSNAQEIIRKAKRHHILLGDWYKNVIDPIGTDFAAMKYTPGSCPNAERAARESVNLPTHINISTKDAERIIQFIRNYK